MGNKCRIGRLVEIVCASHAPLFRSEVYDFGGNASNAF